MIDEITTEEYKVYSDLLRQLFKQDGFIVIEDHTSHGLQGTGPWDHELVEGLLEKHFGIQVDEEKNNKQYALENQFSLDAKVVLLSNDERGQIFKEDGWDAFRRKYGGCGIAGLSRVAFNPEHKFAVLSFGVQFDYLFGQGFYALLKNENGIWQLEHEFPTWRS